jgi:hypothetical protein
MRNALAGALIACTALTSCITFNGKELRRVELTNPSSPTSVIALEIGDFKKTFNGSEGGLANFNEGLAVRSTASQIPRFWKSSGLIKEWGYPGQLDEEPTHRLVVSGTIDESGSLVGAIFTGATLYLFPTVSTNTFDLNVRLEQLDSGKVVASYDAAAKNSVQLWQWIVFLPTTVLGSVAWGAYGADRDMAFFLYDELRRQGVFDPAQAAR